MEGSAAGMAAAGAHGFPVVLTSFVGREQAVCEVAGLLGEFRLVTVTGPGGVGKTRLAGEVVRRVAARFADGAWLAELAPVRDPARVAPAVAVALGVREQPGTPAAEAVARVLARRQLLLVLDNCEHVIGAAAELCAGLLQACDDVRVLATSREPLAVAGEAWHRLAPLSVPGPGDAGDEVAGAEAVVLFADRARAADAGFALTDQNRAEVARLVGRLDGMPLAIELAAARAEALGASQLLESLDDRLVLLASGDRLAAGRHRSLAAAAQWSYELLAEDERRVFRLLSVFPAPFTLEAAGAVAGQGAAEAVLRLVECSLLVPPRPGPDGRYRYAMLEMLRGYGVGLLAAAGEQDDAEAALARYALRVAERAAAGLTSIAGEPAAARWLDAEDATMGHALAWAAKHDLDTAARLATALGLWWVLRGRLAGQEPLLRELAGRAAPGSEGWCAAQFWLAWTAKDSADLPGSLQRCAAVIDVIGDRAPSRALVDCLCVQSDALSNLGRVPDVGAATGRPADAITAWAAQQTLERQGGFWYPASAARRREDALGEGRQALGPDRARAAGQRGAAMSLATAAEYALMLTAPAPPPAKAAPGAARLSARERELVTLVARGRTDADIAGQLYISIRTVRSHLDRIRDKTGCRRRADLTRLALSEHLV